MAVGYDGTSWSYARAPRRKASTPSIPAEIDRRTGVSYSPLSNVRYYGDGRRSPAPAAAGMARLTQAQRFPRPMSSTRINGGAGAGVFAPSGGQSSSSSSSSVGPDYAGMYGLLSEWADREARGARSQRAAGVEAAKRAGFARNVGLREDLSAAGLGFSPRFFGRGMRANVGQTAMEQAAVNSAYRSALADIAAGLQERSLQVAADEGDAAARAFGEQVAALSRRYGRVASEAGA